MKTTNNKVKLIIFFITIYICMSFIIGYIYGFYICDESIIGRIFIGFVGSFLPLVKLGQFVSGEGYVPYLKIHLIILPLSILITYFRFLNIKNN